MISPTAAPRAAAPAGGGYTGTAGRTHKQETRQAIGTLGVARASNLISSNLVSSLSVPACQDFGRREYLQDSRERSVY